MPEGSMKCLTKKGDCQIPAMWDTHFCIIHIDEECPDYAKPLDAAEYMPALVDH